MPSLTTEGGWSRLRRDRIKPSLGRMAKGRTNRLTAWVTSPLQGAEQRILHFSPLNRGHDPGSQTIFLPPGYPAKASLNTVLRSYLLDLPEFYSGSTYRLPIRPFALHFCS